MMILNSIDASYPVVLLSFFYGSLRKFLFLNCSLIQHAFQKVVFPQIEQYLQLEE